MFFIEAGINHFGDNKEVKKILRYFLNSDFQNLTFMTHTKEFYRKYKKLGFDFTLTKKTYQNLIKNCHLNNKKIGLAVCDEETFKPFSELNFDFYKLLSVSINNKNLIEILKSKKKPIYISTGFKANDQKIKRCINLFSKKNKLILLHTPMSYKVSELNFEKINYLKKKFDLDVGYSNHNNDPKTLNFLVPFKPKSIFLYCKPSLKKNRVYPDDKHAFSFEELEKIKENYMYYSNLNKNKKIKKINIFKNEIKK